MSEARLPDSPFDRLEGLAWPSLAAAMAGDKAATNELFEAIQPEVMRLCEHELRRCERRGNDRSQQDFVQEACMGVNRGITSFDYRDPGAFSGWVVTIVKNAFRDYARIQNAQKRDAPMAPLSDSGRTVERSLPPGRKQPTTPDQALFREETRSRVEKAIATLPAAGKEVLVPYVRLHYESKGNVDLDALAQTLGLQKDALRKRIDRYLLRLGERLRAAGGGSSVGQGS